MANDPLKNKEDKETGYYKGEDLQYYLTYCQTLENPFTLFTLNLCNIKRINSIHGWKIGDLFLAEGLTIMTSWFKRADAKIFKEFADRIHVVITDMDETKARKLRENLHKSQADNKFSHDGITETIHISIGYASNSEPHDSIIKSADISEEHDKVLFYTEHKEEEYDRYHSELDLKHSSSSLLSETAHSKKVEIRIARNAILKAKSLIDSITDTTDPTIKEELKDLAEEITKRAS